jgi:hypothetical protein
LTLNNYNSKENLRKFRGGHYLGHTAPLLNEGGLVLQFPWDPDFGKLRHSPLILLAISSRTMVIGGEREDPNVKREPENGVSCTQLPKNLFVASEEGEYSRFLHYVWRWPVLIL